MIKNGNRNNKSQRETSLETENLRKRLGVIYENINNRIQEIEGRISGIEDTIAIKEITKKNQKAPNSKN